MADANLADGPNVQGLDGENIVVAALKRIRVRVGLAQRHLACIRFGAKNVDEHVGVRARLADISRDHCHLVQRGGRPHATVKHRRAKKKKKKKKEKEKEKKRKERKKKNRKGNERNKTNK